MWDWARALGLESGAQAVRRSLSVTTHALPDWVRFSLPDALWVYALTFTVIALQRRSSPLVRAAYLMVPLVLGPGAELAQAVGLVPGTFDPTDLWLSSGALLLGLLPLGFDRGDVRLERDAGSNPARVAGLPKSGSEPLDPLLGRADAHDRAVPQV